MTSRAFVCAVLRIFLDVDRLEHARHLVHLRSRHLGENVPVKMDHPALPAGARIVLRCGFDQPHARVRDNQPRRLQPPRLQVLEEATPAFKILLGAFGHAQDRAKAVVAALELLHITTS